jgi:hypothetical protein
LRNLNICHTKSLFNGFFYFAYARSVACVVKTVLRNQSNYSTNSTHNGFLFYFSYVSSVACATNILLCNPDICYGCGLLLLFYVPWRPGNIHRTYISLFWVEFFLLPPPPMCTFFLCVWILFEECTIDWWLNTLFFRKSIQKMLDKCLITVRVHSIYFQVRCCCSGWYSHTHIIYVQITYHILF